MRSWIGSKAAGCLKIAPDRQYNAVGPSPLEISPRMSTFTTYHADESAPSSPPPASEKWPCRSLVTSCSRMGIALTEVELQTCLLPARKHLDPTYMLVTEELLMSTSQLPHAALLQPTAGSFENKFVAFLTLVDFGAPENSSPGDIVLVPHYHQNYARSQVPASRCLLLQRRGLK